MNQKFPLALSLDDVLLVPSYSEINSRNEVDLSTTISDKVNLKIPLISANVDTITGIDMAIKMGKLGGLGVLPRFDPPDRQAEKVRQIKKSKVLAAASIGIRKEKQDRAEMLVKAGVDILNIDVAHGHMQAAIEATSNLKNKYGDRVTIISGIIATADAAEAHYKAGSDCVALGVGSGSICTTRVQTGCGVPGFTSLIEIAPVAKKYKKAFIPVAGIKNSGDIVKALATGASAVWGGYIFSGTKETPGNVITLDGKKYKRYNGSTSQREKVRQIEKYKFGKTKTYSIHIEGVESLVPYRGDLEGVVESLLAGVRSGMSYCGAKDIPSLWERAKFIRITQSGIKSGDAHDVIVGGSDESLNNHL